VATEPERAADRHIHGHSPGLAPSAQLGGTGFEDGSLAGVAVIRKSGREAELTLSREQGVD
jgi:hypothetical protein